MRFPLLCIVIVALLVLRSAHAWGRIGHEMVANLAYARLSTDLQEKVMQILGTTNTTFGSPLAAVADWADRVRYTSHYHWTTPLHFIDVHDDEIEGACPAQTPKQVNDTLCRFNYTRDCQDDVCVAGAISNYSNILMQAAASHNGAQLRATTNNDDDKAWQMKESLMFVTHFVGDIHQPLHCARKSDKGGNSIHVHFNDTHHLTHHKKGEWNLHSVWDDGIIERALVELYNTSRESFEDDLTSLIQAATRTGEITAWLTCADGRSKTCTSQWAEEGLNDALVWAYRNTDDTDIVDGTTLSSEYYNSRLDVVKRRIAAAGVRLAATLELVLDERGTRSFFGGLLFAFIYQTQS